VVFIILEVSFTYLSIIKSYILFKTFTFSKPLHVLGLPFKNHKTFCHFDATLAIDHKAHNKMKGGGSFSNLGCGVFHEFSSPWFIDSSFLLQLASIAFFS